MPRPTIAQINIDHLRYNYRLLNQQAKGANTMAVVKANAYGHALSLVAPALLQEGCRSFGVTDAVEGKELRTMLGGSSESIEITLLSGIFDAEDAELCVSSSLTPVITEPDQIKLLSYAGFKENTWLKFDSGMNRLGANDPATFFKQAQETGLHIRGFMSHLACADEPDHPLNQQQVDSFNSICSAISPNTPRSLLNSAGIITLPDSAFDTVRPGIALYGAEPITDHPIGLKPVMTLRGEILQVRDIPADASLSYGATFTAKREMKVATISMGYADGIPRSLSNCGSVLIRGEEFPIIGRVCMDYTMVDVTDSEAQPGDCVEFWGEHISASEVAAQANTISYTLFTGIGERVKRVPVNS